MPSAYIRPTSVVRGDETTAGRYSIARYGGPTTSVTTTKTVGTSVSHVLRNNPRRVAYRIFNRSANSIDLSFTSDVTVGGGIPLSPGTGFAEADVEIEGELVIQEVHGIASAASSTVLVVEVIRV
jgi:hypothetical protein